MSSRFSDDLDLVAPEDYVPTTLHALLMHLHVSDAARDVQEAAVRGWLQDHPAGRAMQFTLHKFGFGHLLQNVGTDRAPGASNPRAPN